MKALFSILVAIFFVFSLGAQAQSTFSLAAAVAAAKPGDTIDWPAGTYTGAQTIGFRASLQNLSPACDPTGEWGTPSIQNCIRIRADGGNVIQKGEIENYASSLWFDGVASGSITQPNARGYSIRVIGYVTVLADAPSQVTDHVTITGVKTNGFAIADSHYVKFADMDVGDRTRIAGCQGRDADGNVFEAVEPRIIDRRGITPQNIAFDSIYFHDVNRDSAGAASDCHDGALFVISADKLTIRNSVWSQNWVYDIQLKDGTTPDDVLLENNWFGCGVEPFSGAGANADQICNGQAAVQFNREPYDGPFTNWLMRFNSFGTVAFGCYSSPCSFSNVRAVGNAGQSGCGPFSFAYNAWIGQLCAPSDVAFTGGFVNSAPGVEDFHLAGISSAENLVPESSDSSLMLDIDREQRSAPRDAGSDEFNSAPPPPPPPPPLPQCSDGKDNDLDGKIDFPIDLGCIDLLDDDETDPPYAPACAPTCDEQIATLNAEVIRLNGIIDAAQAELGKR